MSDCEKKGYTNAHAARKANAKMGNSIRPYRCESCGQIHVTKERYGFSDWHKRKRARRNA